LIAALYAGNLALVSLLGIATAAVEYITSKGPASLEGRLFNFNGAPNRYGLGPFYELHVWAWKPNPHGAFADMNPNVSCEHASMK
jgi:hypothetical protein